MGNIVSPFTFTVLPKVMLANGFLVSQDILEGLELRAILCDRKGTVLWQSRAVIDVPPSQEALGIISAEAGSASGPSVETVPAATGPETLYVFPVRTLLGDIEATLAILRPEGIFIDALDHMGTGIVIARAGRLVYANAPAVKVLGLTGLARWDQVADLPPWSGLGGADGTRRTTTVTLGDGRWGHVVYEDDVAVVEVWRRPPTGPHRARNVMAEMVHEIRNPLQALSGFIELAADQTEDETVTRMLGQALFEADRLNRLTAELLTLTRPIESRPAPVALPEAAARAWAMVGVPPDGGIRLDLSDAAAVLNVDSDRFEQVLLNLFKNAAEAMGEGGTVWVSARTVGDEITIRVKDDGPGIPEAVMEGLLDHVASSKPGGSGLGLFIVRRLVEEVHGGRMAIASGPEGTVVDLTFPQGPREAE